MGNLLSEGEQIEVYIGLDVPIYVVLSMPLANVHACVYAKKAW